MKKLTATMLRQIVFLLMFSFTMTVQLQGQDVDAAAKKTYVRNTFEGNYLIDNQSVIVPVKHTFEADIQHRFGTVNNSFRDFFGFFNVSNVRLALSYTPVKDFQVGVGLTGDRMQVDLNLKYAILKQTTDGSMPVSITYFGNAAMDARGSYDSTAQFAKTGDRFSYFNQLLIARKFSDKFSLQIAPSWSHFQSFVDGDGNMVSGQHNDHFAIAFSGRYKITAKTGLIVNYDQPLSNTNSPKPNLSFGLEMKTSGHDFQIFFGNFPFVLPQNNNFYNQNDFTKGQFLIGFNITRLWNF